MSIKNSNKLSDNLKDNVKKKLLDALDLRGNCPNFDDLSPSDAKTALETLIKKLRETAD